jgi:hypothetical protein
MGARLRIYHPGYRPTWFEQAAELFSGKRVRPPVEGADYSLVQRHARDTVRAFLDGCYAISMISRDLVRADSNWRMPERREGQRDAAEALVSRLRFGQQMAGGQHIPLAARWFQLMDAPGGSRLVVRLVHEPSPGMRIHLAANLEEGREDWAVVAGGE